MFFTITIVVIMVFFLGWLIFSLERKIRKLDKKILEAKKDNEKIEELLKLFEEKFKIKQGG